VWNELQWAHYWIAVFMAYNSAGSDYRGIKGMGPDVVTPE
jgi:hypothetical protein